MNFPPRLARIGGETVTYVSNIYKVAYRMVVEELAREKGRKQGAD